MFSAPDRAVFLSYASQDAEAAQRICSALRAAGLEVWFDQIELGGGDAWDKKIRGQIATCALFAPVISAATQARREGYFRIEWKLAAQRTHAMADGTPFLLPIVIDATKDSEALVPEEFRAVQWTRLPLRQAQVLRPADDGIAAFCARVKSLLGGAADDAGRGRRTPPPSEEGHAPEPAGFGDPALQRKVGRRVPAPAWIAAGAALALATGAYFWLKPSTESAPPSASNAGAGRSTGSGQETRPTTSENSAPTATQKSVAVLAFKNLSGDPAREFFSDGLSEAVTDVLGRVPGLKVVGSASAFSFKGKSASIPEIARQLGVTHLVEGTVLQEGQTVRITAKLITADGFQVWVSDKLDRELKNVFAVHDEVAGLIAKNLSLKLGASDRTVRVTVNSEVFDLYVQARQEWNLRTPEGFDRAEELLNRVLALEPDFSRAHAALSDVWSTRGQLRDETGQFGQRESPLVRRIIAAAERAVALDPNSAEAHASLGSACTISWRLAEAMRTLRHAVALNPNYASGRQFLGRALLAQGYYEEATAELARASELDPLSHRIIDNYAIALFAMGRPAEALAAAERALALRPDSVQAAIWRARCLSKLGRHGEAVSQARRANEAGDPQSVYLVEVFVAAGLKSEAEEILAKLDRNFTGRRFVGLLELGRYDEALAAMNPAEMSPQSFYQTNLGPISDEPRFKQVLATLGLTEAHARAQAWRKAHPPEKPAAKN